MKGVELEKVKAGGAGLNWGASLGDLEVEHFSDAVLLRHNLADSTDSNSFSSPTVHLQEKSGHALPLPRFLLFAVPALATLTLVSTQSGAAIYHTSFATDLHLLYFPLARSASRHEIDTTHKLSEHERLIP